MQIFKKWFQNSRQDKQLSVIPTHVAVIMDGNGRWANKRGLPRTAGHRVGMDRVRDAVEFCLETGVKYLTLYAFSTENWQRPTEEVGYLMDLFVDAMETEVAKLHQNNVKMRFIGLKQNLSPNLIRLMEQSEKLTAANQALTLNIALNYGGRSELLTATKELIRAVQKNQIRLEDLTEADLTNYLFTAGQPDPDLLIRPGAEWRTSNFLIWQLAYTELYFSDLFWPDFGKAEMLKAFQFYSQRERRFGRVKGVKKSG